MSRRTRSSRVNAEDGGTWNESADPTRSGTNGTTVKQEKQESAPNAKGKGKARRVESEDDDDEERPALQTVVGNDNPDSDAEGEEDADAVDGDEAEGEGTPKGRKRVRVNGEGHSIPVSPDRQRLLERVQTLPRDEDGYVYCSCRSWQDFALCTTFSGISLGRSFGSSCVTSSHMIGSNFVRVHTLI
ncbi:hypothetical protein BKA83DRAFT_2447551 [Pisolithus microcarpus]|nr:hypothetical protein BKA83DRAFT_2447551 [Pisolithus microcarpus]